jgi:hypothetical protein
LGAGSVALLMAAAAADPAHWAVAFVISSALFAAGAVFALRFGYLALAAAFLPVKVVGAFPLTLDLSAFYAASSIASLGILIGLGLYAYRRAAAGRPRAMQTS